MQKNFLSFVEPFTYLNTVGDPSYMQQQGAMLAQAQQAKKQADLIADDPNPNAFTNDLKADMDRLQTLYKQCPATVPDIKEPLFQKYERYKLAYDKSVAQDAAAVSSGTTPGAGATDGTTANPGDSAALNGDGKLLKYLLIGGGILLLGTVVYLIAKKKSS
jgi:hypothetical protein